MEARRQYFNTESLKDIVDLTISPQKPPIPSASQTNPESRPIPANTATLSKAPRPAYESSAPRQKENSTDPSERPFGSSISKSRTQTTTASTLDYSSFIKPATPGAFGKKSSQPLDLPKFKKITQPAFQPRQGTSQLDAGWPSWVTQSRPHSTQAKPHLHTSQAKPVVKPIKRNEDDEGEFFDIDSVPISRGDMEQYHGDADEHMRELLSGAIGDGEGEAIGDGDDVVDGFTNSMRLMPHQIRGVKWMRERESGRKYGGILADDMGLGKTVQTLACILQGPRTPAELKAGYKGGTLIIAPLAVMEQWAKEIREKTTPGRLKVTTHHGAGRTKLGKSLEKFDVVVTTYQTVASEYTSHQKLIDPEEVESDSDSDAQVGRKTLKNGKAKLMNALFEVKWHRIVLDEAQNIKNRKTNMAKSATALKAKYRWCLTGTPIQNNVDELFSLFHFLRARPLDDWDLFRERVSAPVKAGHTKEAMKKLHMILKAIMLRRTKDAKIDGKPILNLPARTVNIVPCPFDEEERSFYVALEQQQALTFNKFVRAGTVMKNMTSVFTMLLRQRQACDHPTLVTTAISVDADAIESKGADEDEDLADLLGNLAVSRPTECEICAKPLEMTWSTQDSKNTKHCLECIEIARRARKQSVDGTGLPPTSAKIRKTLELLREVDEKSDSKEKTIIFSQFTSYFNLLEPFLKHAGIAFVRYDGKMHNDKRQKSLNIIADDQTGVRVILISFKSGSTGLNLTCCNHVILSDMWWNPALEDQAFDRAHRLGQKRDVHIHKLSIDETVEDRILQLQDSKRELAKAALSGEGAKGLAKLTLNDIMRLFKS